MHEPPYRPPAATEPRTSSHPRILIHTALACRDIRSCQVAVQMAASALDEERELVIHPIVATSVQHNTQVRPSCTGTHWTSPSPAFSPIGSLTQNQGGFKHSQPHRLPIWRRRWNARSRILQRLSILSARIAICFRPALCAKDGWQA